MEQVKILDFETNISKDKVKIEVTVTYTDEEEEDAITREVLKQLNEKDLKMMKELIAYFLNLNYKEIEEKLTNLIEHFKERGYEDNEIFKKIEFSIEFKEKGLEVRGFRIEAGTKHGSEYKAIFGFGLINFVSTRYDKKINEIGSELRNKIGKIVKRTLLINKIKKLEKELEEAKKELEELEN